MTGETNKRDGKGIWVKSVKGTNAWGEKGRKKKDKG
jgi:hypothetical protein